MIDSEIAESLASHQAETFRAFLEAQIGTRRLSFDTGHGHGLGLCAICGVPAFTDSTLSGYRFDLEDWQVGPAD